MPFRERQPATAPPLAPTDLPREPRRSRRAPIAGRPPIPPQQAPDLPPAHAERCHRREGSGKPCAGLWAVTACGFQASEHEQRHGRLHTTARAASRRISPSRAQALEFGKTSGDPGAVGHVRAERAGPRRRRRLRQPRICGAGAEPVLAFRTFPAQSPMTSRARQSLGAAQGARSRRRGSADMRAATEWLRARPFGKARSRRSGLAAAGGLRSYAAGSCGVDAAVSLYGLGISQHLGETGMPAVPGPAALWAEGSAHPARRDRRGRRRRAGRPNIEVSSIPRRGTCSPIRCG